MRNWLLMAFGALALSACGKPQAPVIHFESHPPYYAQEKDIRFVEASCPHCRKALPWNDELKKCPRARGPKKKCEGALVWPETIPCEYCRGSGACAVCDAHKMADFKCFLCKGRGYTDFNTACVNCQGKGVCPVCHGKGTCDYCDGGKYSVKGKKGVREPDLAEEDGGDESGG